MAFNIRKWASFLTSLLVLFPQCSLRSLPSCVSWALGGADKS